MERQKYLDELHLQMTELKGKFKELGLKLMEEGEKLKNLGCPPDHFLLQNVAVQLESFHSLTKDLGEMAEDLSWSGFNGKIDSLPEMEEIWQGLAAHLAYLYLSEEQTEQALAIVKKGKEINLPGKESPLDLDKFKKKMNCYAEILNGDLEDTGLKELRSQLLAGEHPLTAFFELAEKEHLEHEEAARLFKISEREFGTLLSVAAARGCLVFSPPDQERT